MTLQECYTQLEGDYQDVTSRLPSEKFIQKFVLKFLDDKTIGLLKDSWAAEDYGEAFRLGSSSSQLTEALRGGVTPEAQELYPQVLEDYEKTAAAISAYKEGL